MRKTNIGFLKHGDVFKYKSETYRAGHVIDGTNGYVSCTNVKAHKTTRFYINLEVEVPDDEK